MLANKVFIYVEGPSDVYAMTTLFRPLLKEKEALGILIEFTGLGRPIDKNDKKFRGEGQDALVKKLPKKAASAIRNDSHLIAVGLPDLYPPIEVGTETCTTFEQLESNMQRIFTEEINSPANLAEYLQRFKVFCFKHDLEVLLLASEKQLADYLGIRKFGIKWEKEVENQNHDNPPKRIIEKLFAEQGKRYNGPTHASLILSKCKYKEIAEKCPQQFKPFVEFLESLEPVTEYGSSAESRETEFEEKA